MTVPLKGAPPGVRPSAPRSSDGGGPDTAAPFASALDGALSRGRSAEAPRASDRGLERRTTPDERAARTADRAVDRAVEKAAEKAVEKAVEKAAAAAARGAEKSAAAAQRAADRAERSEAPDDTSDAVPSENPAGPVRDGEQPVDPAVADEATEAAADGARPADAPAGGVPAALWALVMGRSLTATTPVESGAGPTTAAVTPAAALGTAPVAPVDGAPAVAVPSDATAGVPAPAPAGDAPEGVVPAAATAAGAPTLAAATVPDANGAASVPGPVVGTAPTAGPAPTPAPDPQIPGVVVVSAGTSVAASEVPTAAVVAGAPAVAPAAPEAADAPATPTADAPGAEAPVPAAAGSSGGSLSGGSGGTGREGSGTAPGAAPAAAVSAVGAGGPVPTTAPIAVPTVEAATGEAAALPVGSQVARQVAVLRGGPDGAHTMTLVLTPETIGPVEVQVTVSKNSVDLMLRGAHEHGRAALLDSLPDLRRDLEAAGLTPARLQVDRDTGGQWLSQHSAQQNAWEQQSSGHRSGQQDTGERSRPWLRTADSNGSGPTPPSQRSTSSGVDVRV